MRVSVKQIHGTGKNRQQHVEVMGDHLNGHAEFSIEFGKYMHGGSLAGQIEVGERFVEHQ